MHDAHAIGRRAAGSRLLERDTEVGAIEAALRAAVEGHGRMVVVAGPGGIGKSQLLASARDQAARLEATTLGARCSELERSFPFGAARQLFEPLLVRPETDRDALFGGAAALAAPLFEHALAPEDTDDGALFQRLHGLYWLVANLAAEGPVVLAVDDAHWADEASLRFLTFLAHRIRDLPAVLLVGSRPVDDPTADPAVGTLLTDPEALQLRPAPLSADAVGEWLEHGADDPPDAAFVSACVHATGGNPFLLRELASAIAAEGLRPRAEAAARVRELGPTGVATTILVRLRRLAPAALELARALAILGDGVDVRTAGAFAGLTDDAALEAARLLEAAGIADAGEGLRFVHPIVRQSVYQDLTSIERGEGHTRAAAFLAERAAPPDAIAAQLLHTPPRGDPATVAALRAAAARADGLGDPISASEYLRRADAEPPPEDERAAVLFELGRAATRGGLADAAVHLEACLALRPPSDTYVAAAGLLAELYQFSGQAELAVDVLERGIAELGEGSPGGRRLAGHLIGPAHVTVPARRRVLPRIERLRDPGGPARDEEELVTLAALAGTALMDRNDGRAAADYALRALAAPLPGAPDAATRAALIVLTVALMGSEQFAASDALATRLLDGGRRTGARAGIVSLSCLRGLIRYRAGRVADAETDALIGLELLPEAHGAEMLAHAGVGAAVLAGIERDRPREALDAILDETPYHRDEDILPYTQILLARGTLRQFAGEHEAALRCFEACDRHLPGWASDTPSMVWWRSAAAVSLSALGREREARTLADEELELARTSGLLRATGIAERVVALVGGDAARADGLRAAAATLARAGAPLEEARALCDLGGELRRTGDRRGAREAFARAHDLADRAGATRLSRVARQGLRTLGARPKVTAGQGLASLTPAERRVAELAAAGRTNRDIAQSLFVSEKTVETHLARVFRKLGVRSRRELPGLLRRRDAEPAA